MKRLFIALLWALCLTRDLMSEGVFGPGLLPHKIIMPARYFYVNLTMEETDRYSRRMSEDLRVEIGGEAAEGGGGCRVWTERLDRRDGSFIVRYKLYHSCKGFYIHVFYKNQHFGGSPFHFHEVVEADLCHCPQLTLDEWLEEFGCPLHYPQITQQLAAFPSVNMSKLAPRIVERFHRPQSISLCHYVLKDNQIYRKCYGEHVGFNMFSDNVLSWLNRRAVLPDIEMFINLGDWPLVRRDESPALPVWSWCGNEDNLDIVLPTYDITESTLENMGRVMLDMLSVQGNVDVPWSQRRPQVFWRGRDSRLERLHLVDIARKHPDLFNVSLTNFFFYRDKEAQYGPKQPHISFFKFFDYKYQLNIDGTVAAYRLPYLLAGGSLVFKQDSKYQEHFYNELKPFTHYVPIKRDLSDLVDRVRWAIDNDDRANEIAHNGMKFARDNLHPHNIICYHAVLLSEWHKRQRSEARVRADMTHVPPRPAPPGCRCEQAQSFTPRTEL